MLLCHFSGRRAVDCPWRAPSQGNPRSDRFPACSSQQLQHHLSSSTKWSTPWSTQNTCQCQPCLPEAPWVTLGTAQHPFSLASASSSIQWEMKTSLAFFTKLSQKKAEKKNQRLKHKSGRFHLSLSCHQEAAWVRKNIRVRVHSHSNYMCYMEGGGWVQFTYSRTKRLF